MNFVLQSQWDGLTQARNTLYESMTAAEQRNEVYKAQLAEMEAHNTKMIATITTMHEEHAKDINEMKHQIDMADSETRGQRDEFSATITGKKNHDTY